MSSPLTPVLGNTSAAHRAQKRNFQWTLYLRQILFETRVVGLWLGQDRLCLSRALQLWRYSAAAGDSAPFAPAASPGGQLHQAQQRLSAAERRVWELEEENARLHAQVGTLKAQAARTAAVATPSTHQRPPQPSPARRQRRADSAMRRLEAALSSQLLAEEARLAQASAALEALREAVEEREEQLLEQHALRSHEVGESQRAALAAFRERRGAKLAWRALRVHARAVAAPARRAREQEEVRHGFAEVAAVQEGRDALGWRVKELHAQLIVLRGQSTGGGLGPPEHDDEGGGAGYLLAEDDEPMPVMVAVTPGELV